MTTSVPVPATSAGGRSTSVEIDDRLLRQAIEEAEVATQRMIALTQQLIELTAENARLRSQLELLQHRRHDEPTVVRDDDA